MTVAIVFSACGIPSDARPRPLPAEDVPFGLLDPRSTTTAVAQPSVAAASAEIFLVAEERLAPAPRQVPAPVSLEAVLAALLAGPTVEEVAAGWRTAISADTRLRSASTADGIAHLDLSESFAEVEGEEQILALAQLVFTATALPGIRGVAFRLAGSAVEVPTADGTLKEAPIRRADFAALGPT
ncbi:MAG: GerMN domain-containing protein [Actinomycetota bacterium]|nr:GerMN domain-containing protein [Actinomycetota bacterium]